jgi:hypothetical protein
MLSDFQLLLLLALLVNDVIIFFMNQIQTMSHLSPPSLLLPSTRSIDCPLICLSVCPVSTVLTCNLLPPFVLSPVCTLHHHQREFPSVAVIWSLSPLLKTSIAPNDLLYKPWPFKNDIWVSLRLTPIYLFSSAA